MKKLLLLIILFSLITDFSFTQVTFDSVWVRTNDNGLAPAWFTDGSEVAIGNPSFAACERGIVYSAYSGHVYVSSRHSEDTDGDQVIDTPQPHVYVLDPKTGEAPAFGVSQLLTQGITSANENYGGGYPLNNVTTTVDGSIFACNMTLASGPPIIVDDYELIKAFRVYRWDWEQGEPAMIIDYDEGGYRLGDKFTVTGDWTTEAYIYAVPGENTKILRWKVTAGVVDAEPTFITMQDIASAGTSPTVAPVPGKSDWIYVSGKGFMPTLFHTDGTNLTQVAITAGNMPSSLIAGRIIEFGGKQYMGMFSGDQSAFVFEISKHGENVTDADIIGFTPTFGTKYDNAYGEGAIEFGVIDDSLQIFICAPTNGIACYEIRGLDIIASIERELTDEYNVSVYPNPATDFARVKFTLPQDANGPVSVKLYDLSGKFIAIIADKAVPGKQEISINTSQLPSGTYIYQLVYGNKVNKGKLIVK